MPDTARSLDAPVAVVGCGVIGSGWIARLLLHGCDVRFSDPSPGADEVVAGVLENARLAWQVLGIEPSTRGRLLREDRVADAVDQAVVVIEAVPERLDVKQEVYAAIESAAPVDALIASSTSGIRPSQLQAGLAHPERLLVGHPFNPVYLLPLVEVVPGEATGDEFVELAMAFFEGVSMKPLRVRVEIDAFIADRLLEAVWREALWLVHDGVATTGEIDDAMRYGFGLRWAQMGLFETYRIAGGTGGVRHFLAQFGETLSWPWTKLMDTPELDEALIELVASQSDQQSGQHTIRELERIRDRNIAGFLRVLESEQWGAGLTVAEARRRLADRRRSEELGGTRPTRRRRAR